MEVSGYKYPFMPGADTDIEMSDYVIKNYIGIAESMSEIERIYNLEQRNKKIDTITKDL